MSWQTLREHRTFRQTDAPAHATSEEMSMTWQEFEQYCEDLIRESLDPERYRICPQYRGEYGGVVKVMDFHIAERRQGGRHFVVDCKHFQVAPLNRGEIETTRQYQRLCRANPGSIILVSSVTNCPESVRRHAEDMGVEIIEVDIGWRTRIPLFRRLLRRGLDLGLPDF